jgi:uncharacterized membrane protein
MAIDFLVVAGWIILFFIGLSTAGILWIRTYWISRSASHHWNMIMRRKMSEERKDKDE